MEENSIDSKNGFVAYLDGEKKMQITNDELIYFGNEETLIFKNGSWIIK